MVIRYKTKTGYFTCYAKKKLRDIGRGFKKVGNDLYKIKYEKRAYGIIERIGKLQDRLADIANYDDDTDEWMRKP